MKMLRLLALPVLVATSSTCRHSSPTTPTGQKVLQAFGIAGNSNLTAVGQTSQFTATASYVDGSTDNVTKGTTWEVGDVSVGQFGLPGLLTAKKPGETTITARFGRESRSAHVLMLPAGTHILTGTVREPGLAVSGATVEILDGPTAGLSQTTGADGSYKLYGVTGMVTMRARKDGYVAQTQSVSIAQDQVLDFTLMPVQPPTGITPGPYQATFIASPACTQLPDDLRTRTYAASLSQDGARLDVTLTGPGLNGGTAPTQTTFSGRVVGNTLTFQLLSPNNTYYYYYYYYFGPGFFSAGPGILLDQLTPTRYFSVSGAATGTIASSGIKGKLVGSFVSIDAPNGLNRSGTRATTCAQGDHQFAFSSGVTTSGKRTR